MKPSATNCTLDCGTAAAQQGTENGGRAGGDKTGSFAGSRSNSSSAVTVLVKANLSTMHARPWQVYRGEWRKTIPPLPQIAFCRRKVHVPTPECPEKKPPTPAPTSITIAGIFSGQRIDASYLGVKPHERPVLLHHERRGVADDVVHPPADAEGVHHQRDRQPEVLVADGSEHGPLQVSRKPCTAEIQRGCGQCWHI